MIANQDIMVHTFWDCNKRYFNNALPTPIFETMNSLEFLGRFEYIRNPKKSKKSIRNQIIKISDCFDYPENVFIELMVHEMIHYYIAWNRIKDNKSHGKEFMRIANEMNEKHGLEITQTLDASSFKLTEKAPKIIKKKGFFAFLFG